LNYEQHEEISSTFYELILVKKFNAKLSVLTVCVCIFWTKKIVENNVFKMLVKFTPGF